MKLSKAATWACLAFSGLASAAIGQPTARAGQPPWWHDAVFYEIFVRSFADSTQGPLARDGIGDIPGLIERLDYLNDGDPKTTTDLGITAIWLMPIHPSPSYHGYDVTDFKGVNPQYGTTEDFQRLVAECHKRGIKVVIDLVINHTSDRHPWFIEAAQPGSPKRDWYTWAPSDKDPGWRGSWNQVVWHRYRPRGAGADASAKPQWYLGLFSNRMPDLNAPNPAVTAAINDVCQYWLTTMNIDGFRLDAIKHLVDEGQKTENTPGTHKWLKAWRTDLAKVRPGVFTVGEVWDKTEVVHTYVGDQLESGFDFDLASAILAACNSGEAGPLAGVAAKSGKLLGTGRGSTFLANHDQDRAMSQLKGDTGKAKLAAALQFTLPGVPFVYYGEEIGMVGQKPDEKIRTPMQWSAQPGAGFVEPGVRPWQAINPDVSRVNVAAQTDRDDALLPHYRRLIALRQATPALARGDFAAVESGSGKVLAFLRRQPVTGADGKPGVQRVLVVANVSGQPVTDYALKFKAGTEGLDGEVSGVKLLVGPTPAQEMPLAVPAAAGLGAVAGYKPLAKLAARGVYVIELQR